MNTIDAINARRSIRKYLDQPVEFEKITTLLDASTKAPNAGNLQGWRFIIVSDKNLIKQISGYCVDQYWVQTAPILIVVCSIPEKHELYYGLRGKRLYVIQDCASAITTLQLAAVEMDLSTCWVGAFEEEKLKTLLAIPADIRPQAIVTLGYADETPKDRESLPIESVVFFNRYGLKVEKLHILLRDYSEEWPRQKERLRESTAKHVNNIKESLHKLKHSIKDKFKKKEK
jgi:nitroreductase